MLLFGPNKIAEVKITETRMRQQEEARERKSGATHRTQTKSLQNPVKDFFKQAKKIFRAW
jgi:hypothetical protein